MSDTIDHEHRTSAPRNVVYLGGFVSIAERDITQVRGEGVLF